MGNKYTDVIFSRKVLEPTAYIVGGYALSSFASGTINPIETVKFVFQTFAENNFTNEANLTIFGQAAMATPVIMGYFGLRKSKSPAP